ncbi:MAG: hypothetical protein FRX48_01083 [Lasallia pustulata]|uniref:WD40/YVTN repeat-like-containing domain n=1 Tax=Lasallia pustulata TaxID=136370 RepID=A0A5M8Q598_9LECA|nr:MAG: hypothetical protein FRX48_01083 [Lasallia pustulata]
MPASSDYPAADDQQDSGNNSPAYREEQKKSKHAREGRRQAKKKDEQGRADTNKERASWIPPEELTPPPSLPLVWPTPRSPQIGSINGISSPLLVALGATPTANDTSNSTTEWARNVPFGRSPPRGYSNGVSIAGSPPDGSTPPGEIRGGFSNASPPRSPPTTSRQPVRRSNGYQSFGDYLSTSPGTGRPTSMRSHSQHPPLPHHPQPHFYGAPNVDLGLPKSRAGGQKAGDGYYCGFDGVSAGGYEHPYATGNVLLVGSEGALDVYKVDGKDKPSTIGRLDGLRGGVIEAKILPGSSGTDLLRSYQPLVAIVVHGPHLPKERADLARSSCDDAVFDPSDSMLLALNSAEGTGPKTVTHYQTTVEIYSLKTRQHIETLFSSPTTEISKAIDDPLFSPPLPNGNISVQASGRFIVIASGISGEVFVFEARTRALEDSPSRFRCIGKTWTSVPPRKARSWSASSSSSEMDSPTEGLPYGRPGTAILSLSHRWLAVVPPTPSARSTLHGTVDVPLGALKIPGLSSHTAPSQPPITCDLDTPEGESLLNRVARDMTQELIKGARWVGDQGMQAWKNYWNKPEPQAHPGTDFYTGYPPPVPQGQQNFPPTHAHDEPSTRTSTQPALVSVLDLEKLSESHDTKPLVSLQPVATFQVPYGCSFVSFAPSGLVVLTATAKGDVQHVWDLMCMVYGGHILSTDKSARKFPFVRQIACFTRMTVANLVDVVWTEPSGERFAIVTDRGTVHIFDLPQSAFRWPPQRRLARPATAPGQDSMRDREDPETVPQPASAASTFSAAIGMVNVRAQPLLNAVRSRPKSIGKAVSGLSNLNFTAGAGAKGGKAVAAGFSKSVGAATGTVNTIRHLGENRLHLPGPPHTVTPGCVKWLNGKNRGHIAVVGKGILRIYGVHKSTGVTAGQRRPSVVGGKPAELIIPDIRDETTTPALRAYLADETPPALGGYWSPGPEQHPAAATTRSIPHPLSYAEIETNAPYQPFHTDRRINLQVYADNACDPDPHHLNDSNPWVFGEAMPATKISVGSAPLDDEDTESDAEAPRAEMENLINLDGEGEGEGSRWW